MRIPHWILDIGYWRKILPAKVQVLLVNPIPIPLGIRINQTVRIVILRSCTSPYFSMDYHLGFTHFRGFMIVITRDKRALSQSVFGCAREIPDNHPNFKSGTPSMVIDLLDSYRMLPVLCLNDAAYHCERLCFEGTSQLLINMPAKELMKVSVDVKMITHWRQYLYNCLN